MYASHIDELVHLGLFGVPVFTSIQHGDGAVVLLPSLGNSPIVLPVAVVIGIIWIGWQFPRRQVALDLRGGLMSWALGRPWRRGHALGFGRRPLLPPGGGCRRALVRIHGSRLGTAGSEELRWCCLWSRGWSCRVSRSRCESLDGMNDSQAQVGKAKGVSAFRPLELKQS